MIKKTVKEVDSEVDILKKELNNLQQKFADLSKTYLNLEKKNGKCNVENSMFKCGEIDKEFDKVRRP